MSHRGRCSSSREQGPLCYISYLGTLIERLGRKALESNGSDQNTDPANDSPAAFTMLIVDAAGFFVFFLDAKAFPVNWLRKISISA